MDEVPAHDAVIVPRPPEADDPIGPGSEALARRRATHAGAETSTGASGDLVIDLLDALESLVVNGRRVPFSAAVMVNEDEALDYVDRARAALPEDVKQARVVVERRQEHLDAAEEDAARLIGEARQEAERLVGAARAEADRLVAVARAEAQHLTQTATEHAAALVGSHAVAVAAEQRAAEVTARAAADAEAYKERADGYARDLLTGLAGQVDAALAELHRGIEMLGPAGPQAPGRRPRER